MKEEGKDRVKNQSDEEIDRVLKENDWPEFPSETKASSKSKKGPKKSTALITKLKTLLDTVTEEDLKIYGYSPNAKEKVQFRQFPDIIFNNAQILESHPRVFKTKGQLNSIEHKIGAELVYYFFITRKGIPLSDWTKKYIEREPLRNFRGQLDSFVEEVKESIDFYTKGLISQEGLEKDISDYIERFDSEEKKKVASKLVDNLLESGEHERSEWRTKKREERGGQRKWELKYSKLKEVK